ncbi:hypothetical protein NSS79_02465 [Paenibacillus sp. FSL L8-0436]|uniref:hypothetical protein n=1 Tax=Paenibacillus sp. FSL L8-0436 TaxID=2954686 RepID=UPI00315802E7
MMRPLIIVETAAIETMTFLSAQLYGEDGHLLDSLIYPWPEHIPPDIAVEAVRELAEAHRFETVELWTANVGIFAACLAMPGVGAAIKHPSDTASARRAIEDNSAVLIELYDIKPVSPDEPLLSLPPLPRWRAVIAGFIRIILKTIEGDGKYEI